MNLDSSAHAQPLEEESGRLAPAVRRRRTLVIDPVAFALDAPGDLAADAWPVVYDEFLDTPRLDPAGPCIPVQMERGVAPDLARLPLVFEAGRSWCLLRDGAERVIVHAPHGLNRAEWSARVRGEFEAVEIGCGPAMQDDAGLRCPLQYPLDQVLMMHLLPGLGGTLLHAAGVVVDGRLLVLAGRSGAGKSTLSRLAVAGAFGTVISDDRLVLRWRGDALRGSGTPWPGTERIARHAGADVAAVLFLGHDGDNQPRRLAARATLEAMLPLVSVPWHEPAFVSPMLDVCGRIATGIPAFHFPFSPNARAVDALARLLSSDLRS